MPVPQIERNTNRFSPEWEHHRTYTQKKRKKEKEKVEVSKA
jgi:hypothetical protein